MCRVARLLGVAIDTAIVDVDRPTPRLLRGVRLERGGWFDVTQHQVRQPDECYDGDPEDGQGTRHELEFIDMVAHVVALMGVAGVSRGKPKRVGPNSVALRMKIISTKCVPKMRCPAVMRPPPMDRASR